MHKNIGKVLIATSIFGIAACSKVSFDTKDNSASASGTKNSITCSTYFNSKVSSVTVSSSSQNPTVYADCNPSNVNLAWLVKNSSGTVVSISGLQGKQSVGDFYSAGNGTYSVTTTASADGYNSYVSSPITATVTGNTASASISCDVRINGQYSPVTLQQYGANPTLTATCTPSGISYQWTVTNSSGTSVTVPGIGGSTSTPDFLSMPAGTYNIYFQGSQSGYQTYNTTNPLVVTVPSTGTKPMVYNSTVNSSNNLLDILLIVDDSSSMLANNQKLAAKLKNFVDGLGSSGYNWQMCVTVTHAMRLTSSDPNYYWGASVNWTGNVSSPGWILKSGTSNTYQIFTDTINNIGAGWAGTDDERPLKAAWWSLWNGDYHYSNASGCYRENAGLAVVMISNEDERSIGGDISQKYYSNEYYALESDDLPNSLINQVKSIFGTNKRFVFNSIVVRPGDNACMQSQDAQGTKSHYGVVNSQPSTLTNGYIGSICDADYSQSIKYFQDQIVTQMKSVKLDCAPVGSIQVTLSPNMNFSYRVDGSSVIFDPAIPVGTNILIKYNCAQ